MKILLSPSTQFTNPYHSSVGGNEAGWMRKLAEAIAPKLRAAGHQVDIIYVNSLYEQVSASNRIKPDLHIDLHSDASGAGIDLGSWVFYVSNAGKKYSDAFAAELKGLVPFRNNGSTYRGNLYVLNRTNAPAILIEHYGHDTEKPVKWGTSNFDKFADLYVRAIARATGQPVPAPVQPTPSDNPNPYPGFLMSTKMVGTYNVYVEHMQRHINNWLGFDLKPDGYYGPATRAVIIAIQKKGGLDVDGVVGPATWAYIFSGKA